MVSWILSGKFYGKKFLWSGGWVSNKSDSTFLKRMEQRRSRHGEEQGNVPKPNRGWGERERESLHSKGDRYAHMRTWRSSRASKVLLLLLLASLVCYLALIVSGIQLPLLLVYNHPPYIVWMDVRLFSAGNQWYAGNMYVRMRNPAADSRDGINPALSLCLHSSFKSTSMFVHAHPEES